MWLCLHICFFIVNCVNSGDRRGITNWNSPRIFLPYLLDCKLWLIKFFFRHFVGLTLLFLCFIQKVSRYSQLFLGYVLSTKPFFAFYSFQHQEHTSVTGRRGHRGDARDASPPPDLKRCWHDTWFHSTSSPKYFCTAHYSLKMLKFNLC